MKTHDRVIRLLVIAGVVTFSSPAFTQQDASEKQASASGSVELEGAITTIQLGIPGARSRGGQGCHVGVKTVDGEQVNVGLGPMRYLLEQSFSPEAGDAIEITAIPVQGSSVIDFVAVSARLPSKKQEIKLRSADGHSLWGGRRHRGGQSRP